MKSCSPSWVPKNTNLLENMLLWNLFYGLMYMEITLENIGIEMPHRILKFCSRGTLMWWWQGWDLTPALLNTEAKPIYCQEKSVLAEGSYRGHLRPAIKRQVIAPSVNTEYPSSLLKTQNYLLKNTLMHTRERIHLISWMTRWLFCIPFQFKIMGCVSRKFTYSPLSER